MPKVVAQSPKASPKRSTGGGVLDRIKDIEAPERGIRMAVFGRSGTGKTTFACDFPKPLLFIRPPDDDGRRSVYKVPGIKDVDIQSVDDLITLCDYLTGEGSKLYKTAVLDNASALQELVLKAVTNKDELPAQLSWGDVTQQQWGQVGVRMKDLLRKFLDFQGNALVLAQEREFNTDTSTSELLEPFVNCALSPSVTGWLGPHVDYLVQTFIAMKKETKKVKVGGKEVDKSIDVPAYYLRTGPHPVYSTKFRVPKGTPLPEAVEDPNYSKVYALLSGSAK